MSTKSTDELENILNNTHINDLDDYLSQNQESFLSSDRPFRDYMLERIKEKELKQQDIFIDADIPERYGYKLISEEKRTKQRDVILRVCYASKLNLSETQKALKIYGMPLLYAKVPRDACIMVAFNERPGNILDVNQFLKDNGMAILRPSGTQE